MNFDRIISVAVTLGKYARSVEGERRRKIQRLHYDMSQGIQDLKEAFDAEGNALYPTVRCISDLELRMDNRLEKVDTQIQQVLTAVVGIQSQLASRGTSEPEPLRSTRSPDFAPSDVSSFEYRCPSFIGAEILSIKKSKMKRIGREGEELLWAKVMGFTIAHASW